MIRALFFFVLIAAVLYVGNWLLNHPGTVNIALPGYFTVNWSLAWGATVLAVLLVLAVVAVGLLTNLFRTPKRIIQNLQRRNRDRGQQAISMGMVAVAAGDAAEARKQSQRASRLLPDQPMTTLLAAQSSQMNGDTEAAQRFFKELADHPEASFLGLRGLWMQAMKEGRTRDALHYAELANEQQPHSGWVLESLFELHARVGQWEEADRALAASAKQKTRPPEQIRHDRALINIERSRAAAVSGDKQTAMTAAKAAYKALPEFVPAAAQYAEMHIAYGRRGKAEKVIQDMWRVEPHPMLGAAYHKVVDQVGPEKQLRLARDLGQLNPNHPESRALVAEFAIAAEDWSEARRALAPLAKGRPSARVCRLMAELELAERHDPVAARDWIARSATATPDPAWVCSETGAVQREWSAVCHESRRFGTLEWRVPHHLTPASPALLEAVKEEEASEKQGTQEPKVLELLAEPVEQSRDQPGEAAESSQQKNDGSEQKNTTEARS